MLTILDRTDQKRQFCDGISRRNFLKIGGLGFGGLSLPQLLEAESQAGTARRQKSIIMIYLVGGPPHQDMFDLKPDAPAEIRGPWNPIATNVPGIQICEAMPRLAGMMDKLIPVRSIVGAQSGHDAYECFTGRHPRGKRVPPGGWPSLGATVSKVQGNADRGVPPFVSLCYTCTHGPYNEPGPGFLGPSYSSFRPMGPGRDDMVLQGITTDRLGDRKALLASVDRFRRVADASGMMRGMDAFTQQAMGVLTSSKLVRALDLTLEDPKTVARYGTGDTTKMIDGNGAPRVPQNFLMARRLIEAGARVVTVNYSKWDWHGGTNNSIFKREAEDFPIFDQALSALIEDLHDRGMLDDVSIGIWGEFGRTPMISARVGRDHWPRVACAMLAGGGMKTGQVIGATDRLAGEATERPVTFPEIFATMYHNLGIDVNHTTIRDLSGRPQYLVDNAAQPISELV